MRTGNCISDIKSLTAIRAFEHFMGLPLTYPVQGIRNTSSDNIDTIIRVGDEEDNRNLRGNGDSIHPSPYSSPPGAGRGVKKQTKTLADKPQ